MRSVCARHATCSRPCLIRDWGMMEEMSDNKNGMNSAIVARIRSVLDEVKSAAVDTLDSMPSTTGRRPTDLAKNLGIDMKLAWKLGHLLRATTPGGSVSMSSDGTRVAIGSPSSSDFFDKSAHSKAGYVRVLQLQEQEQDNSARAVIWICIVIGILLVLGWASRRNQPCQRRTIINSGASQL